MTIPRVLYLLSAPVLALQPLAAQEDIPLPTKNPSGSSSAPAKSSGSGKRESRPKSSADSTLPPLPDKPSPLPAIPDPVPSDSPDLPTVQVAPTAPGFPKRPTEAPKVYLKPKTALNESSVQGGQFRVYGRIKEQRDVVLEEAEQTRRAVMTVLQMRPDFVFSIVVQIRETTALAAGRPNVWTSISQLGDGFRIELNLVPTKNAVDGPLLQRELVRCILAERLLRAHHASDLAGRDIPPPDWMLYGLLELMEYQSVGRPSDAFSSVFRLGHVMSLEDIFNFNPDGVDSVSRMVYRASACGLLLMLLERSNGGKNFAALCDSIALMPDNDVAAIARCYPELNSSGNSLGKWWSLQLAAMSQPGLDELLSPGATDQELTKALTLHLAAQPETAAAKKPKKGLFSRKEKKEDEKVTTAPPPAAGKAQELPFTEYARAMDRKDRQQIFDRVELDLTQLALRAHPLYRPVLGRYLDLVKALGSGKSGKDTPQTIASLALMRRNLLGDMDRTEDYLDWFEATQTESISGSFYDYLRTVEETRRPLAPRRDPLSRYMNLMESEYQD